MARDTNNLIIIPGEFHSAATGNVVAASEEIFDYDSSSYQSQLNKQIYNVSAHNNATYTLDEAINSVPVSYRIGGLILTFISKDNVFEIYQLKSTVWDTDTDKWGVIPFNVIQDNPEYIEVHLDSSNKILYGVQSDGNFYFGGGVPSQIKNYVTEKDNDILNKVTQLDDKIDSSISSIKSDVSTGFARIDASIKELGFYEQKPEFINVTLDSSNRILYGVQSDGNFYFGGGVPSQIKNYVLEIVSKAIENLNN